MNAADAGGGCRRRMQEEDAGGGCRRREEEKEARYKSRTFTRGEEKTARRGAPNKFEKMKGRARRRRRQK